MYVDRPGYTLSQKFWIGVLCIVIVMWYVLAFVFFHLADYYYEYDRAHPFLWDSHRAGPQEVFCHLFALVLSMGDVGLTMIGLGWVAGKYTDRRYAKWEEHKKEFFAERKRAAEARKAEQK